MTLEKEIQDYFALKLLHIKIPIVSDNAEVIGYKFEQCSPNGCALCKIKLED